MNSVLPIEISLSKKSPPAVWGKSLPEALTSYRLPNQSTYYLGLNRTAHVVARQLFRNQTLAWINHFLTGGKPYNCFVKSKERCIIFYYVMQGSIEYRNRMQHIAAARGNINLLPAIDHEFLIRENSELFFLFIPVEMLNGYKHTFPVISPLLSWTNEQDLVALNERDIQDDGRVNQLIAQLVLAGVVMGEDQSNMLVEKLIIAALDQLFPFFSEIWMPSNYKAAVQVARSVILTHLHEGRLPSLEGLSRMVGMNTRKLETIFKQYCNTSMLDFYHEARMEAIYRALHDRNKCLRDIADGFNYEDYSTFSAAVKRKWGRGPRDLRNGLFMLQNSC
ncbi:helix-turn-helix domain-containing protein [Chitinophaga tropicalis]|uniref:Helix-turn-helix domain-containing protein n=1 Tax=Chitinophaga tropicalis TaxID=2683588 RepID=A0A7K1U044_9BACT|nr:AraC family transcriptional regulator [Chitinophaga tropicalis]MVT07670.1 helix-turn-helix domain-containing protein [Chitinophaga tropicalis]